MSFCETSLHVCGLSNNLSIGTLVLLLRLDNLWLADVSMVSDCTFPSSGSANYGSVLLFDDFFHQRFCLFDCFFGLAVWLRLVWWACNVFKIPRFLWSPESSGIWIGAYCLWRFCPECNVLPNVTSVCRWLLPLFCFPLCLKSCTDKSTEWSLTPAYPSLMWVFFFF